MCLKCDLLESRFQIERASTIDMLTKAADRLDDLGMIEMRDSVLRLVDDALPPKEANVSAGVGKQTEGEVPDPKEESIKQAVAAFAESLGIDQDRIVLMVG